MAGERLVAGLSSVLWGLVDLFLLLSLRAVQFTLWLFSTAYLALTSALWGVLGVLLPPLQAVLLAVAMAVLGAVLWILGWVDRKLQFGRWLRDEWRKGQEVKERRNTDVLAQAFVDGSSGLYSQLERMEDMGSRLQKMWYQVTGSDGSAKIMTLAPISINCALKFDKKSCKTLNSLLHVIKHPLLQVTDEIMCLPDAGYLLTVQPLMQRGSLKDLIYQAHPLSDWAVKYAKYSKNPLEMDLVASYGRQILEATLYLYKLGLQPLGHIQSGNIFVEGEMCSLGGYTSRLLGYRTRLYSLCQDSNCSEDIDIIMFGCIIFEMACGYELTELVPGHHDYQAIKYQLLKEVLEFIFRRNRKGRFLSTMEEILALEFFQEARLPSIEEVWPEETPLTKDMRQLIARVVRGVRPRRGPTGKRHGCSLQ